MDATIYSYPMARRPGPGLGDAMAVRARDRLIARWRSFTLDRALAAGAPPEDSAPLLLRAHALLDPRTRRDLGYSLRRILRQRSRTPSIGTRVPVRRDAVAQARDGLDLLARRLLGDTPVAVRGVARVRVLLSDGSGSLFWDGSGDDLRARVEEAVEALDPENQREPAPAGRKEPV